jgi:hypothetical protein
VRDVGEMHVFELDVVDGTRSIVCGSWARGERGAQLAVRNASPATPAADASLLSSVTRTCALAELLAGALRFVFKSLCQLYSSCEHTRDPDSESRFRRALRMQRSALTELPCLRMHALRFACAHRFAAV